MNRAHLLGGALACSLAALSTGALLETSAVRAQGGGVWLDSYPAAQAAARQAGKPIFLVFR